LKSLLIQAGKLSNGDNLHEYIMSHARGTLWGVYVSFLKGTVMLNNIIQGKFQPKAILTDRIFNALTALQLYNFTKLCNTY
jgi:hypothetical protein